jgi:polysaccharide export outer membrane protein
MNTKLKSITAAIAVPAMLWLAPPLAAQEAARARKIAPNDILAMKVAGEPDLSIEYKVDGEGKINVLYVGSVTVVGKSSSEVAREIRDALDKDWIIDPQVSVEVKQYDTKYVTVMGAVAHAQQVQILPDHQMDVLEAIAGAGDFTRDAKKEDIKLQRKGTGEIRSLKYSELSKITDPTKRVYVEPGDRITVERTVF